MVELAMSKPALAEQLLCADLAVGQALYMCYSFLQNNPMKETVFLSNFANGEKRHREVRYLPHTAGK